MAPEEHRDIVDLLMEKNKGELFSICRKRLAMNKLQGIYVLSDVIQAEISL